MQKLLINKRAYFDYEFKQIFLAGIVLSGSEVKSLRLKNGSLRGSFVKIINQEAILLNVQISPYKFSSNVDYDSKRTRKLLLRKKEIYKFSNDLDKKGYSLIPLAFILKNKLIKMEIGLGKGRKIYQKKSLLKQRDLKREMERELKNR